MVTAFHVTFVSVHECTFVTKNYNNYYGTSVVAIFITIVIHKQSLIAFMLHLTGLTSKVHHVDTFCNW